MLCRNEELMARSSDSGCAMVLGTFSFAHQMDFTARGSKDHALSLVGLDKRRVPLLAKLQLFWDQATVLYSIAFTLQLLKRKTGASKYFQRDIGAAHGLFSVGEPWTYEPGPWVLMWGPRA